MTNESPPPSAHSNASLECFYQIGEPSTCARSQILRLLIKGSRHSSGTTSIFGALVLLLLLPGGHSEGSASCIGGNQITLAERKTRPHPNRTKRYAIVIRNNIHPEYECQRGGTFDGELNKTRTGIQFLRGIDLSNPRNCTGRVIRVLRLQPTSWHGLA